MKGELYQLQGRRNNGTIELRRWDSRSRIAYMHKYSKQEIHEFH